MFCTGKFTRDNGVKLEGPNHCGSLHLLPVLLVLEVEEGAIGNALVVLVQEVAFNARKAVLSQVFASLTR